MYPTFGSVDRLDFPKSDCLFLIIDVFGLCLFLAILLNFTHFTFISCLSHVEGVCTAKGSVDREDSDNQ